MTAQRTLWSVCIPNYNYERYLPRTLDSAVAAAAMERELDVEVVVADNASTDGSVAVIRGRNDARMRVEINRCNVGFAGNLDRAARLARGDRMIMLSSDDLIRPDALRVYRRLAETVGDAAVVLTSTMDQIDQDDVVTGRIGPDPEVWTKADLDAGLSGAAGVPVYRVDAGVLLHRSLAAMKNPFNFAATCYRREDYERVEGYGGGRLINPDKWFHWRLLGAADCALFVDAPLFAYRWHPQNQTAQQAAQGALKFLVDEYACTLEADKDLLAKAGLERTDLERAFVERDVLRHGLATLAKGDRAKAARILDFGRAVYPHHVRGNRKSMALMALLRGDVVGQRVAGLAYKWWGPQA